MVSNTYLRHRHKHNNTYILLFEIIGPWFEPTLIAIINCIFSPFEAFQLKKSLLLEGHVGITSETYENLVKSRSSTATPQYDIGM